MRQVQILGPGCPKCKKLEQTAIEAIKELNLDCEVVKVADINQIMNMGVMMTPALAIDGSVKVVGRVPGLNEIKQILTEG